MKTLIFLELGMALVICLIASIHSFYLIAPLALFLGFLTEGTDPATASILADALGDIQAPQKAAGIRTIANGVAKALFPFLIGFVAAKIGIIGSFYVLAALCFLPILPAVMFLKEAKTKVLLLPVTNFN